MKLKVVVHEEQEGGYWAEVPALPGCLTQGETMDELMFNVHEAVEAYLPVEFEQTEDANRKVIEIAV